MELSSSALLLIALKETPQGSWYVISITAQLHTEHVPQRACLVAHGWRALAVS